MSRLKKHTVSALTHGLGTVCLLSGVFLLLSACEDGSPTSTPRVASIPVSFSVAPTLSSSETEAISNAFDRVNVFHVVVQAHPSLRVVNDTLISVTPGQSAYDLEIAVELEEEEATFLVTVTALEGTTELFSAVATIQLSAQDLTAGGTAGQSFVLPVRYVGPGIRGIVQDINGNPVQGVTVDLHGAGTSTFAVTDAEGTALFSDLTQGSYTLAPRAEAGIYYCPASHQVTLADPDAISEGVFRQSPFACQIRVLVLSGGDFNHNVGAVSSLSSLMPDAEFSTYFFLNDPPSLTFLSGFNVVLLYEDGVFGGSETLGDRVAEYLARGGNLVVGTFYWQNRSDGPFVTRGWGALEGSDIFSAAGGAKYTPGSMDPSSKIEHAVMEGVNSIESTGFWGGVAGGGSGVLARWNDGTPLVGVSGGGDGSRIAAISFFPGGGTSGDGMLLYANALQWAGTGSAASGAAGSSGQAFSLAIPNPGSADPANPKPTAIPSKPMGGTHHRR